MKSAFVPVAITPRHTSFTSRPCTTPLSRPTYHTSPRWRLTAATPTPSVSSEAAASDWQGAKALSASSACAPTVLTIEQIMKILPHRYPFLLVDRVLEFESGVRAVAVKSVTVNEPFFPGHFPELPIMPGVLQVEALAQVGGIAMLHKYAPNGDRDFFFGGVDKVKWRKPVVPGDTLVLEMNLTSFREKFGIAKMEGKGYVNGDVVVEGQFTLVMMPEKKE